MKTSRTLRGLALAATVAAGIGALPAAAQESDDFSFARRLAYRGWFDLADDICKRIERDHTLPREVRSALPILLAEIELAKADREQDAGRSLEHITRSIARLDRFIADEPSHPRSFEAKINIGYLKSRKAKSLVDQLDSAKTPDQHDRLRKEASALYDEVTAGFEDSVTVWKRLPASDEVGGAIMDARLEADRARYEHARIPGLPDEERKKLLADAIKNLVDFEIDYGDTAKAFEAMLLEGKCLMETGEVAQAEVKLKNTLSLDGILRKEKIPRNEYFDSIIYGTYLTLTQLYLKTNRPKDARVFIETTFANDPAAVRAWIGMALKVELVDAYFRLKDARAKQLAEDIIKADPDGPFGRRMKERIAHLGSRGHVRIDQEQAIRVAEGSMDKGRLRDAMAMLRQAIEGQATEESRAKNVPKALFLMGQCLQDMKRNYEAAIVFEKVVALYPKHELGVKACWEAIVCFSNEFDTFEDPLDERDKDRLMETLLRTWPGAKEADNIPYLQGLKLENAKKHREAAEKYLAVPERAPAYERSLVRGAYCLRVDAFRTHADYVRKGKKDPAELQAMIDQLNRAEGLFRKFLDRIAKNPAENAEQARDRVSLVGVTDQELAYLYNHVLIGKAEKALEFLDKVASEMSADDDRLARINLLQIQSQLVLNRNDDAVKTLELMFHRFENVKETAQACKSVAIRLDEITADYFKKNGNVLDDYARENLKKISKYYAKWVQGAMRFSMNASVNDVMSVGESLYVNAKRLNSLPETVQSFMDMKKGMLVGWKNYFEEAEFVHSLLVGPTFRGKYAEKDRLILMARRARCLSFIADSAEGWGAAKNAYEEIVKDFGIKDAQGQFSRQTIQDRPLLLGPYLEVGAVYFELGRWTRIHYDNAISVFTDVASVSAPGSEPWWIARYMTFLSHFRRGGPKDIMTAQIGIKMIEDNYPDFDAGKYGLKEKFIELKKEIERTGAANR
ncbi:MAG TPA: tetratricopeptide repeat protein [Planctomycetota bacterium]|nr:tetratricopeptide repeat protein [Planctomycetota bacterium]